MVTSTVIIMKSLRVCVVGSTIIDALCNTLSAGVNSGPDPVYSVEWNAL